MKCFKCEKELEYIGPKDAYPKDVNILDGGTLEVYFGYGSVYDQIGKIKDENAPRDRRLSGYHNILGFICDKCFHDHSELFEAYKEVKQPPKFIKVV